MGSNDTWKNDPRAARELKHLNGLIATREARIVELEKATTSSKAMAAELAALNARFDRLFTKADGFASRNAVLESGLTLARQKVADALEMKTVADARVVELKAEAEGARKLRNEVADLRKVAARVRELETRLRSREADTSLAEAAAQKFINRMVAANGTQGLLTSKQLQAVKKEEVRQYVLAHLDALVATIAESIVKSGLAAPGEETARLAAEIGALFGTTFIDAADTVTEAVAVAGLVPLDSDVEVAKSKMLDYEDRQKRAKEARNAYRAGRIKRPELDARLKAIREESSDTDPVDMDEPVPAEEPANSTGAASDLGAES